MGQISRLVLAFHLLSPDVCMLNLLLLYVLEMLFTCCYIWEMFAYIIVVIHVIFLDSVVVS